ncbi:hypothetical protein FPL04_18645 [Xanthomonas arboricola]|nr:hypothetical protein FPL04_18645 [Xanthomonas arboricola]
MKPGNQHCVMASPPYPHPNPRSAPRPAPAAQTQHQGTRASGAQAVPWRPGGRGAWSPHA